MSLPRRAAEFLYTFRYVSAAVAFLGALAFAPQANLTNIDNDLAAWISRDDPIYQTYERFREEFGGTRTLIIAIKSDRIFSAEGLQFIDTVTSEIQRIELVERVNSLATANIVRPLPGTRRRRRRNRSIAARQGAQSVGRAARGQSGTTPLASRCFEAIWLAPTAPSPPLSSPSTRTASTKSAPASSTACEQS